MNVLLGYVVCASLVAFAAAELYETDMVDGLEITKENQDDLGLPLGTVLTLDETTQLFIPPKLSHNFTAEDRINLILRNPKTSQYYCKLGPKVKESLGAQWCRGGDGENLCCGENKCLCNIVEHNCACLSENDFDYWSQKEERDVGIGESAVNAAGNIIPSVIQA